MAFELPKVIKNIAIIGAGGQIGTFVTNALLSTNKFNITALTRKDSKNTIPTGVTTKFIDYTDPSAIVSALLGTDVFIFSLAVTTPPTLSETLIRAAAQAKVPFIIPNDFGSHHGDDPVGRDVLLGPEKKKAHDLIEELGMIWFGVACGFWYEFSLSGTMARYGFDFENKEVRFLETGDVKMNTSTWPQVGRGVAALLSLPVENKEGQNGLLKWKNRPVLFSSFRVSQKDMFESVLRVTGDKESDWKISYKPAKEVFLEAQQKVFAGDYSGFGTMLYSRMFCDDAPMDFEELTSNKLLGLPVEDLDEATRVGVKMAMEGYHKRI